jgi:hypothetical protein
MEAEIARLLELEERRQVIEETMRSDPRPQVFKLAREVQDKLNEAIHALRIAAESLAHPIPSVVANLLKADTERVMAYECMRIEGTTVGPAADRVFESLNAMVDSVADLRLEYDRAAKGG